MSGETAKCPVNLVTANIDYKGCATASSWQPKKEKELYNMFSYR